MIKVYELFCDYEKFSSFILEDEDLDFYTKYWNWKHIDLKSYKPIKFKLYNSDKGKKNYQFDISQRDNLLILSERAVEVLKPILQDKGQFIPIDTPSKRKKFVGFVPNKEVYSNYLADLDKSDWGENEKGKLFFKVVFKTYPRDEYIFTVDGSALRIYATEKFKELLEKNNLKGLDFHEVQVNE